MLTRGRLRPLLYNEVTMKPTKTIVRKKGYYSTDNALKDYRRMKHHQSELSTHDEAIDRTMQEIAEVLHNPPETWEAYSGQPSEHYSIIQMEYKEMIDAYNKMKAGTGTHADFVKSLIHMGAAVSHAYADMTCNN